MIDNPTELLTDNIKKPKVLFIVLTIGLILLFIFIKNKNSSTGNYGSSGTYNGIGGGTYNGSPITIDEIPDAIDIQFMIDTGEEFNANYGGTSSSGGSSGISIGGFSFGSSRGSSSGKGASFTNITNDKAEGRIYGSGYTKDEIGGFFDKLILLSGTYDQRVKAKEERDIRNANNSQLFIGKNVIGGKKLNN